MVTLICARCGKPYKRWPAKVAESKYCSRRCQYDQVEVKCQRCGKTFLASPKRHRKFCSPRCAYGTVTKTCKTCGKPFDCAPSDHDATYCSVECKNEGMRNARRHCKTCGKPFHPRRQRTLFCSRACARKGRQRRVKVRCVRCGKPFFVHWGRRSEARYCGTKCRLQSQKRVKWPSRIQLEHLVTYLSYSRIAALYSVTASAVEYWTKVYEIVVPRTKKKIWSNHQDRPSGYIGENYGV